MRLRSFRDLLGAKLMSGGRYLASNYNLKLGKVDEARALLQSGMTANPSRFVSFSRPLRRPLTCSRSLLLGYTLAELEEGRGELPACYKIYDDLISHFHARLASLETATEQEIVEAMAAFDAAAELEEQKPELGGFGDEAEGRQKTVQEKEEAKVAIRKRREEEVNVAKRAAANVWITEMRFARRAEVSWTFFRAYERRWLMEFELQGIKQARSVFTKARKSPFLAWQVYEASGASSSLSSSPTCDPDGLVLSDNGAALEQRAQDRNQHLRAWSQVVLAGPRVHPPVPRLPHPLQQPQQCAFLLPPRFASSSS